MYSCAQLSSLNIHPKINDISLNLLREYYEIYLNPYEYHYKIIDNTEQFDIKLRFDKENLCHLLGIESIVKLNINRNGLYNYKGMKGWENIKNGTLNFDVLKRINKKRFNNVKDKFVFFYLIPNLIKSPKAIYFDNSKVLPCTTIECEILFFNGYDNSILHLGIEPNTDNTYYIPRTLLIEKINPNNDGLKYINNQQEISVEVKDGIKLQ